MNVLMLGQSNAANWFKDAGMGAQSFQSAFQQAGRPVNLINGAVGGTSLLPSIKRHWLDEGQGSLYARALERAKAAGNIDAVIWIQGEADVRNGIGRREYRQGLHTFFDRLRGDLGNVPVYMQPLILRPNKIADIRQAQFGYDRKDRMTEMVEPRRSLLDTLDGKHFTQDTYGRIGNIFARRIMRDFPR